VTCAFASAALALLFDMAVANVLRGLPLDAQSQFRGALRLAGQDAPRGRLRRRLPHLARQGHGDEYE
jgi:hypothetical protein